MRLFALAVGDHSRDNPPMVASNVISISAGPRWRVLLAHQRGDVRHVVRTLIETEHTAIIEVADGDAALMALEHAHFDVLVLELDLPVKDGVSVMQIHRLLLAHECRHVEPPAIVFSLAPEVRSNATLTDYLRSLGVAAFIDDAPRPDTGALIDALLHARGAGRAQGKPAAA
jgi:CheY-like chemotaxis protein